MHLILKDKTKYILRFDQGEELLKRLNNFCKKERVKGAWFWAIGSTEDLILSYFNLRTKSYQDKRFKEKLEIVGLSGNVAMSDKEIVIHAHGSFSDPKMKVCGGHVKKLVVGATCELFLQKFSRLIQKEISDNGLRVMR